MIRGTTKGRGSDVTVAAIVAREDFRTSGAVRGEWSTQWALTRFERTVYRVYSYAAVIAEFDADSGLWLVATGKRSATTSTHQSLVRRALLEHKDGQVSWPDNVTTVDHFNLKAAR